MAFWSGETLSARLPALIAPFDAARIDCAAYTLTLGPEVFVTTDQRVDDSPDRGLKLNLEPGGQCRIPPGQFAFLLTEEEVQVPHSALAFISMRARWKFRGLVNVSGFHVDPGWKGRLVFSVYNAGPSPIVFSRGADVFLIWYADLDQTSTIVRPPQNVAPSIPDHLIEGMTGQVFSPIALTKDVNELKEKAVEIREDISSRHLATTVELTELRTDLKHYKWLVGILFTGVIAFAIKEVLPTAIGWLHAAVPEKTDVRSTEDRTQPLVPPAAPEKKKAEQAKPSVVVPARNPEKKADQPKPNAALPAPPAK